MTSRTTELLIPLHREDPRPLGRQIEEHLRASVRSGRLKPGAGLPSTRDLAAQLGISRPIVVEAYSQLASEGFLLLRQGARPRVVDHVGDVAREAPGAAAREVPPRFDLRPATPDLAAFPRKAWLRALRGALNEMHPEDFGYAERHGCAPLRGALAEYLGRVRNVVADPSQVVVTSGFAQGRSLFCRAIAARGGRRVAVEDPGYSDRDFATAAGLELVPVPVDGEGIDVARLAETDTDAVILTPTHQSPTGVALSGDRRRTLVAWLEAREAYALEDDYDAEFRYDRAPIGAVQGLRPERVVYAGTASKTLAPGLRLGWLVVPASLREAVLAQHRAADHGAARIEQHALAGFIRSGELDRHLRRMRLIYRRKRDLMIDALAEELPEARIEGMAAGLQIVAAWPRALPERAVLSEAARRGLRLEFMSEYAFEPSGGPSRMLLGYGQAGEAGIRGGIRILREVLASLEV